jgi:hypothetical protein
MIRASGRRLREKDHAQSRSWSVSPIQFERTMLYAFDSGAFCLQVIPPEGKML